MEQLTVPDLIIIYAIVGCLWAAGGLAFGGLNEDIDRLTKEYLERPSTLSFEQVNRIVSCAVVMAVAALWPLGLVQWTYGSIRDL